MAVRLVVACLHLCMLCFGAVANDTHACSTLFGQPRRQVLGRHFAGLEADAKDGADLGLYTMQPHWPESCATAFLDVLRQCARHHVPDLKNGRWSIVRSCTRGPDSMAPCCETPFVRMVHHKTEEVVGVPNGSYSHRGGGHNARAPRSPLALVLYALILPWLTSTIVMGAEVPIFW